MMNRTMRLILAFIVMVFMLSQVAFAANCDFTFTANGKTYYATHHATDGYYECFNPEPDTSPSFNDPSPEHLAYMLAFDAAKDQHHAACPYVSGGDLGDEELPDELPEEQPLPETGDGANLVLWSMLAAISAIGMTVLFRKRSEA